MLCRCCGTLLCVQMGLSYANWDLSWLAWRGRRRPTQNSCVPLTHANTPTRYSHVCAVQVGPNAKYGYLRPGRVVLPICEEWVKSSVPGINEEVVLTVECPDYPKEDGSFPRAQIPYYNYQSAPDPSAPCSMSHVCCWVCLRVAVGV